MVDDRVPKANGREEHPHAATEQEGSFGNLRQYVPRDLLDVSFPVSVRGYDRRAVDGYVQRVNQVIAELKVGGSPPTAVRHALDQAQGKVEGLLQAAREAAEQITASARQEAEEQTARAKAEAANLIVTTRSEADRVKAEAEERLATARWEADAMVGKAKAEADELRADARAEAQDNLTRAQAEANDRLRRSEEELATKQDQAEARIREMQTDTEALWKERSELLDDIRTLASGLVDLANAAAARVTRQQPLEPEEGTLEPEGAEAKRGVAEPRA